MNDYRWGRCIHHRGHEAATFISDFFADSDRSVFLIGGAGFDPRSYYVAEQLTAVCGDRLRGFFLREERPDPSEQLLAMAEGNDARIRELIPRVEVEKVQVFDIDNAPVGGRRITRMLAERVDLSEVSDVVLDLSALSVGVMFPSARCCLEAVSRPGANANLHILVLDAPGTDSSITSTSCGKVGALHTFSGELGLDSRTDAARLWLPQLGPGRREVLSLIYQNVQPHAVCPIIPCPSADPRLGDALIEEYGDLFDAISGPMTPTWDVDSRDIVYAHEKSPLDLYRSILRIDDSRRRVFDQTGGSQLVLSPLGSKAVAVGLLMAALERGFAVVSVESIEYRLKPKAGTLCVDNDAELVHVWLSGTAYQQSERQQEAHT